MLLDYDFSLKPHFVSNEKKSQKLFEFYSNRYGIVALEFNGQRCNVMPIYAVFTP